MKQNTTLQGKSSELTTAQTKAIGGLLARCTVTRAAEQAGVDRTTVHRWLRADWGFQAALNRARREIRDAVEAQLHCTAERAAGIVSEAVAGGDTRVALAVLKGLGLLDGQRTEIGKDDPDTLRDEADLTAREAASEQQLREMCSL